MSVSFTGLGALAVAPSPTDVLAIVDVSDTTQSPQGTTKKITVDTLFTSPTFEVAVSIAGTLNVTSTANVTGNFTVNTNKFTVAATTGNTAVAGTFAVAGVATLASNLAFSAAVTVIIPGATSIALVNAANNANNLLITDAGLVTLRNTLTIGAGGFAVTGNSTITGSLTTTTGFGYPTGVGGAVTQLTNRTTAVTINKLTGTITTINTSLSAELAATFTVNNSTVLIGDVVTVGIQSGSNSGDTNVYVSATAAGSFNITVANNNASGGAAETGAILINFAVVRAVSA